MFIILVLLLVSTICYALPRGPELEGNRFIVTFYADNNLNNSTNITNTVEEISIIHHLQIQHIYTNSFRGFSFSRPGSKWTNDLHTIANHALRQSDSRIKSIQIDAIVSATGRRSHDSPNDTPDTTQTIPTGIQRIQSTPISSSSSRNSRQHNIGIAVVDTGVGPHPDLVITDGIGCQGRNSLDYTDKNGHGTHCAGTISAIDNSLGVLGIIPQTPLYAVRVLSRSGTGYVSDVICGLEWVLSHKEQIQVVSMSLASTAESRGVCGKNCDCFDAFHVAVCNLHKAGVTIVAAAGNSAANVRNYAPAAFTETIAVGALADFDGLSGSLSKPTCREEIDDNIASFSNYGDIIDIVAPGVCINSTYLNSGYYVASGTSMAAPHVAASVALLLEKHPEFTPDEVKEYLVEHGNMDYIDTRRNQKPALSIDSLL